ncbi:MAG: methyltransferase domain-containing protein [Bacteroidales bacterium]|nr:methyltransferase domain-containing protein [Bacteroidales bacterium]
MKPIYNKHFYNIQIRDSYNAARIITPIVLEEIKPRSIIDIGCGIGTWLKAWKEIGIDDYLGIDGDYIDMNDILIEKENFIPLDLNSDFDINRKFDLVECLEVAEHLPFDRSEAFIRKLTQLGDIILFSAAPPYQGGTDHVNENWLEYWAIHFRKFDYIPIDSIRKRIWENPMVSFWYKQNIIFFVKKKIASTFPNDPIVENSLSIIHPEHLLWATNKLKDNEQNIGMDINYYRDLTSLFHQGSSKLPPKTLHYTNLLPNKRKYILKNILNKLRKIILNQTSYGK